MASPQEVLKPETSSLVTTNSSGAKRSDSFRCWRCAVILSSILLLFISFLEVFNLVLILVGVPPDTSTTESWQQDDDFFNGTTTTHEADPYQERAIQHELQTWHPRNNVDMIISVFGILVALLGLWVTNKIRLRPQLALLYLFGTLVAGTAWMAFNYWFTVHVDEEFDDLRREERHNETREHYDDDVIPYKTHQEYYLQNLSLMAVPALVWISCCFCAFQYQRALALEAKLEQETRMGIELAEATATSTFRDDDVDDKSHGLHAKKVGSVV